MSTTIKDIPISKVQVGDYLHPDKSALPTGTVTAIERDGRDMVVTVVQRGWSIPKVQYVRATVRFTITR